MKQPLLVTAAIITEKNKVLLVKRVREPFKDYWCFIGGCGGFERTSDPVEAVKDEVKGEIHCDFKPHFFSYSFQKFEELEINSVVLYFYGTIIGNPKINKEYASKYKWVTLEEAANLNLGFDHQKILRNFAQTQKNK